MNTTKQIIFELTYLSLTTLLTSSPRCLRQLKFNNSSILLFLSFPLLPIKYKSPNSLPRPPMPCSSLTPPISDLPHHVLVSPLLTLLLTHWVFVALKQIKLIPILVSLHTLSSLGNDACALRSLHSWLFSNNLISVQISPLQKCHSWPHHLKWFPLVCFCIITKFCLTCLKLSCSFIISVFASLLNVKCQENRDLACYVHCCISRCGTEPNTW